MEWDYEPFIGDFHGALVGFNGAYPLVMTNIAAGNIWKHGDFPSVCKRFPEGMGFYGEINSSKIG